MILVLDYLAVEDSRVDVSRLISKQCIWYAYVWRLVLRFARCSLTGCRCYGSSLTKWLSRAESVVADEFVDAFFIDLSDVVSSVVESVVDERVRSNASSGPSEVNRS